MSEPGKCKKCDGPIVGRLYHKGRPRIYCTDKCRLQDAYLARKAAGKIKPRKGG